jgi:hypothetical protein
MRELTLQEIAERVQAAGPPRTYVPRRGGRPRSREEQLLLTRISMERWEEALATGAVVKISPREWFYAVRP